MLVGTLDNGLPKGKSFISRGGTATSGSGLGLLGGMGSPLALVLFASPGLKTQS